MYTPALGSAFPTPAITERPMSFSDASLSNNPTFSANSHQQFEATPIDQNREVGDVLIYYLQADSC